MKHCMYLLDIHACFYLQVLEEFYQNVDKFDKGAFLFDLDASNKNALKTFLSPQNLKTLVSAMAKIGDDPEQKIEELEMDFLKRIILDYFGSGTMLSFEELKYELHQSDWFNSIVYTTSLEYTELISEDFALYEKHIYSDECVEMFQEFFRDYAYLKKGEEEGHFKISTLAINAKEMLVLIFNQLKTQKRTN